VEGVVRLEGETSGPFQIDAGVKQGDSLSPLLFVAFMDEVTKICKRRTDKTKVGNWRMQPVYTQALVYADDIVLIANTAAKLQQAVTEWTETLKEKGMSVNTAKTKVMQVGRTEEQISNVSIMCNGVQLEQVQSFEYLGTVFHQCGKIHLETLNRVKKTNNAYFQLCNTIFGKREIETKTKLQVYNTVLEPILLYGSESWPSRGAEVSKITAAEMKCLRRIAGKTRRDRVRNDRIREDLQQKAVKEKMGQKQLKWFGHVTRMPDHRKPKQFHEAKPEGRRPVGRPRISYEDHVEELGRERGKSMSEMKRLARDKKEWRRFSESPPTL
jgi:hypothetical protein